MAARRGSPSGSRWPVEGRLDFANDLGGRARTSARGRWRCLRSEGLVTGDGGRPVELTAAGRDEPTTGSSPRGAQRLAGLLEGSGPRGATPTCAGCSSEVAESFAELQPAEPLAPRNRRRRAARRDPRSRRPARASPGRRRAAARRARSSASAAGRSPLHAPGARGRARASAVGSVATCAACTSSLGRLVALGGFLLLALRGLAVLRALARAAASVRRERATRKATTIATTTMLAMTIDPHHGELLVRVPGASPVSRVAKPAPTVPAEGLPLLHGGCAEPPSSRRRAFARPADGPRRRHDRRAPRLHR